MVARKFAVQFQAASIDRESGVIFGVSVITEGEARGHGMIIDRVTLEQVKACAETYKNGLKVKMDHYSGVAEIVGYLTNFQISGTKLTADLHLFESCEHYEHVLEIAETIPDSFGLSIVFSGEDDVTNGTHYARCKEIYSADLVSEPAANPSGLFSNPKSVWMSADEANEFFGLSMIKPVSGWSLKRSDPKPVDKGAPSETQTQTFPMTPEQLEQFKTQIEAQLKKLTEDLAAFKTLVEQKNLENKNAEAILEAASAKIDELASKAIVKALSQVGVSALPAAPAKEEPKKEEPKTFEQLVADKVAGGMKKTEALQFCIANHSTEYEAALKRGIKSI